MPAGFAMLGICTHWLQEYSGDLSFGSGGANTREDGGSPTASSSIFARICVPNYRVSKFLKSSLNLDRMMTTKNSKSLFLLFHVGRYTTVRLRACISPFPQFSESSIKTVLTQSAKNRDFFRQRNQTPHKRVQYRSWGSLKMRL